MVTLVLFGSYGVDPGHFGTDPVHGPRALAGAGRHGAGGGLTPQASAKWLRWLLILLIASAAGLLLWLARHALAADWLQLARMVWAQALARCRVSV